MMSPIEAAALKFVVPAVGSVVILTRFRNRPLLAEAMQFPKALDTAVWMSIYIGWMLATDLMVGWRGPWNFSPWLAPPVAASVLRVLAVVFAGPLLEELVFRGLAYGALASSRAGSGGAIAVTAVTWSVLHWSYEPLVIVIIMISGIILGVARWKTRSLFLPIAMHIIWNAYAIW